MAVDGQPGTHRREGRPSASAATGVEPDPVGALPGDAGSAVRLLIEFRTQAPITDDGLADAAEVTLAAVQDELRTQSSPLEISVASELAFSRLWSIHALLVHTGSHSRAKRYEQQVTDGAPLAICLGTGPWFPPVSGFRKAQQVSTYWGVVSIPALGCHAIIPESTRLGGVMWRYWWDDCATSRGAKARAQARRHKQLVEEIHTSRSPRP